MATESIPWVEKYRPTDFNDIVLEPTNRTIMQNMIAANQFPNLLLYGPPGTGKTTTIINLVNMYQERNHQRHKGLMIHLNASDERGVDVIRNQIYQFVNSQALFVPGMKFVVLDEVDYMTKNAQQALKYLLHEFSRNVRFCLICNYISRIDDSLQNEFVRLRFNQLPKDDVIRFLSTINTKEQLGLTPDKLASIQRLFKSDIRSMINYMQSNQHLLHTQMVMDDSVWDKLTKLFQHKRRTNQSIMEHVEAMTAQYNVELKSLVTDYFSYVLRRNPTYITPAFLEFIKTLVHLKEPPAAVFLTYFVHGVRQHVTAP
jgi:DNA polymerase III delta prime subunit